MPLHENEGMGKSIPIYILLSMTMFSLGFGVSKEEDHSQALQIAHNNDSIAAITSILQNEIVERKQGDSIHDESIRELRSEMVSMFNKQTELTGVVIDQNNKMLDAVQLQNQILKKQ